MEQVHSRLRTLSSETFCEMGEVFLRLFILKLLNSNLFNNSLSVMAIALSHYI